MFKNCNHAYHFWFWSLLNVYLIWQGCPEVQTNSELLLGEGGLNRPYEWNWNSEPCFFKSKYNFVCINTICWKQRKYNIVFLNEGWYQCGFLIDNVFTFYSKQETYLRSIITLLPVRNHSNLSVITLTCP